MAVLTPFRALRPAPAAAAGVAAVPYDVVTTEEARALAAGNPLSFLHVSRAEIDLDPDINPYDQSVYAKAMENMERLTASAPLVYEDRPSVYAYRLRMGSVIQTGIAACYSLDEYEQGAIKKHERTRADKEDDRTRHLLALRAQTGPVFLVHRPAPVVDGIVEWVTKQAPLFDFVADDGVAHTVWHIGVPHQQTLVEAFASIPALYIADGHHRAASAARARRELREAEERSGEWDTLLAVAFPAPQVNVLPYNRVVVDLAGLTPDTFMQSLRQRVVDVKPGHARPERRGEVGMYLDGRWHTLVLGDSADAPATERLDVSRLQHLVLDPLLNIGDVRSSKRIDFVGGGRGPEALESIVRSGRAAVAFSMYPVSVDAMMDVADAGGIMPPKSTWFEPKLRDGLLSHVI